MPQNKPHTSLRIIVSVIFGVDCYPFEQRWSCYPCCCIQRASIVNSGISVVTRSGLSMMIGGGLKVIRPDGAGLAGVTGWILFKQGSRVGGLWQ